VAFAVSFPKKEKHIEVNGATTVAEALSVELLVKARFTSLLLWHGQLKGVKRRYPSLLGELYCVFGSASDLAVRCEIRCLCNHLEGPLLTSHRLKLFFFFG
jgi:hypothetical protein